MNREQIKAAILKLPDAEIQPLLEWLRSYYDGDVWDRQMKADIERFGAEEWEKRLQRQWTDADYRLALLRVVNAIEPCSDEKRVDFVQDLVFLLGRPLDSHAVPRSFAGPSHFGTHWKSMLVAKGRNCRRRTSGKFLDEQCLRMRPRRRTQKISWFRQTLKMLKIKKQQNKVALTSSAPRIDTPAGIVE